MYGNGREQTTRGPVVEWDDEAWFAFPNDRWVYDKLRLYEAMGYACGPAGIDPEGAGPWWMKPQMNLRGMGLGSGPFAAPCPAGHIWMPRFEGRHISTDYLWTFGGWQQALTVEATYDDDRRIVRWTRIDDRVHLARRLEGLFVPAINVETIGGCVIDVHLRLNHDFDDAPDAKYLDVVWEDTTYPDGRAFIAALEDADGLLEVARLGFMPA